MIWLKVVVNYHHPIQDKDSNYIKYLKFPIWVSSCNKNYNYFSKKFKKVERTIEYEQNLVELLFEREKFFQIFQIFSTEMKDTLTKL